MSIISETFNYGRREPQWLLERPKEHQSYFDQRGCVRQIKSFNDRTATRHIEDDLPRSRSARGSYLPEQPSVSTDRQAVVYNALPSVTHRIPSNTSYNVPSNTSYNVPIVEFMVPLCCGKCVEKVKEELENDEGVYKVMCDLHNQRVTVSTTRDPNWLLKRIKRMKKNSHFWRGSTHFKDAHYVATRFPSQKSSSHHSQALSQPIDIPAYREAVPAHHRASPPQHQNRRFVASGSPYDDGRQYYYHHQGAEYPEYKSSSAYETSYDARMYDATATSFRDSLHHGHHPSSYGQAYARDDYALHLTRYY